MGAGTYPCVGHSPPGHVGEVQEQVGGGEARRVVVSRSRLAKRVSLLECLRVRLSICRVGWRESGKGKGQRGRRQESKKVIKTKEESKVSDGEYVKAGIKHTVLFWRRAFPLIS